MCAHSLAGPSLSPRNASAGEDWSRLLGPGRQEFPLCPYPVAHKRRFFDKKLMPKRWLLVQHPALHILLDIWEVSLLRQWLGTEEVRLKQASALAPGEGLNWT